jgi:lia operon protein LiaG
MLGGKMLRFRYMVALAIAAPLVAQTPERHTLRGDRVAIYDLVGDVRIVEGSGRDVVIELTRQGSDASQLRVETGDISGVPTLRVIFPFDRIHTESDEGHQNISDLRVRDDGTFGHGVGGRRVTISSRSGADAAADLVIRLPSGTTLDLKVGAGSVNADGTRSNLSLDVISADITLKGTRGNVVIDAASGGIEAQDVEGDLNIDTGSGSVELLRIRASDLRVDTGSGMVRCENVTADEINIDTGSGGVEIGNASARSVRVDVGSGSVDVALSREAKDVHVHTGSGSVTLRVPESIGAEVDLETGSGDIDSDVPITIRGQARGELRGQIGDGTARITVSTGSGGIRIRRA